MVQAQRQRQTQIDLCPTCGFPLRDGYTCHINKQENSMVILELTNKHGKTYHFVGINKEAIMEDTQLFGDALGGIVRNRELTLKEAREMGLRYLDTGIDAVKNGIQKSFKLAAP